MKTKQKKYTQCILSIQFSIFPRNETMKTKHSTMASCSWIYAVGRKIDHYDLFSAPTLPQCFLNGSSHLKKVFFKLNSNLRWKKNVLYMSLCPTYFCLWHMYHQTASKWTDTIFLPMNSADRLINELSNNWVALWHETNALWIIWSFFCKYMFLTIDQAYLWPWLWHIKIKS